MKKLLCLAAALCTVLIATAQVAPKREMRGVWLTTHLSLDWPNRTQTPAQQRSALLSTLLDHNKATGINSVFLQVRSQVGRDVPEQHRPLVLLPDWHPGHSHPARCGTRLQYAIDEIAQARPGTACLDESLPGGV